MAIIEYAQLSDVPEDLRDNAREDKDAGKFTVNVVPRAKVDEFRENSTKIAKERDDIKMLLSKYEHVTSVPSEKAEAGLEEFSKLFETLRTTKKRVDDGVLVENTSLDEASATRVADVTKNYQGQLADSAKEKNVWKSKAEVAEKAFEGLLVENIIRMAASDSTIAMHEKAVTLLLPEALSIFRVDENKKVVPKDKSGAIIYGQDGISPMSAKEWLMKQRDDNHFLFKGATGGDASGGKEKTFAGKYSHAEMLALPAAERMEASRLKK